MWLRNKLIWDFLKMSQIVLANFGSIMPPAVWNIWSKVAYRALIFSATLYYKVTWMKHLSPTSSSKTISFSKCSLTNLFGKRIALKCHWGSYTKSMFFSHIKCLKRCLKRRKYEMEAEGCFGTAWKASAKCLAVSNEFWWILFFKWN